MAYSNWGAFVYKNGNRRKDWEDAVPYKEEEKSIYYSEFLKNDSLCLCEYHAILGKDKARLCGYKHHPSLFIEGKETSLEPFLKSRDSEGLNAEYQGEIDGYKFHALKYNGNMLELFLSEPDGTVWKATCGYEFGAGHMDC